MYFGNPTNGADSLARTADILAVSSSIPMTSGTIKTFTIRAWSPGGGSANVPALKVVVYSDNSNAPNTLLATSDELIVTNTTEQVLSGTFSGAEQIAITAGTRYWYGLICDAAASPQNLTISRTGSTNQARFSTAVTYPTLPGTFPATSNTNGPLDIAIHYQDQVGGFFAL